MIGRVYRGGQVGGLMRYLYGPGRHNEHESPRLVAAWDLSTPAELATLEPPVLAGQGAKAMREFRSLTGSLELATELRPLTEAARDRVVWHCPLRTAPGDRVLSDAEWAEVARDVMDRTGIARRGDDGGCRWVAVRHDDVSIHLVAVLARQDGQAVRIGNDFRHLREACRAAEQRLGLTPTAPADRTAATHIPRAEVEKARRIRGPEAVPDRAWLRQQVQLTASWARNPSEFLNGLRQIGIAVRERRDSGGLLTGYAVARQQPAGPGGTGLCAEAGAGALVFYGGGKLAPDLTLPQLLARWPNREAAADVSPSGAPATGWQQQQSLPVLKDQTSRALARAADLVRQHGIQAAQRPGPEDPRAALAVADIAAASAEIMRALAWQAEGHNVGPVRRAAQQYDRAGRATGGRRTGQSAGGAHLRELARLMLRLTRAQGRQGDWGDVLLQALNLAATVAELRRVQQHQAQHAAALAAVDHLRQAVHPLARPRPAQAVSLAPPDVRTNIALDNLEPRTRRPAGPASQGQGRSR